jgi:V/A-type H+-transporting ATPase subunit A
MLKLILDYDQLCRNAIKRGANVQELFEIPARESIGRAKSVEEDAYVENYAQIRRKMEEEIEAVVARGGEQL